MAPSVVALIAAFNEADIIETVVGDLVDQGIQVYFLDDGSTDGTAEIVERRAGRGVIGVERLARPNGADGAGFGWERILRRKAALASELDADWFIHHDADEFRESPWPGLSLRDGIAWVDSSEFNAIDFACLDFWADHDGFERGDVREAFTHYAPAAPYDRVQIRCWKKTGGVVDLTTTGGHEARFPGRRVFPVRFILRHYPIRGQRHGERKIHHERRFLESERARGWHVQYDAFREGRPLLTDRRDLQPYDPRAIRLALAVRHRGVEELEERVSALQGDLDARGRELETAARDLETLRTDLDSRTRALETATQEREAAALTIQQTRDEAARLTAEVAARTGEIETMTLQIATLRRQVDEERAAGQSLQAVRDEQARQIDGLQRACDDRGREIEAFRRSLSWRWTAPGRALYRLLGGR